MPINIFFFRDCGASVELLTPRQIKAQFPWINTDGVALGSYGMYYACSCYCIIHVHIHMQMIVFVNKCDEICKIRQMSQSAKFR